jgi:hypothetical protein
MKKSILFLIFTSNIYAALAQNYTETDFKFLHALAGTWKMETSRGAIFEAWQVQNDHTLQGKSYKLNNGDTLVLETVLLFLEGNKIVYQPTVTNQNNGQPVRFQLISAIDKRYVFENKEHDYPQRVIYHLVSNNAVHARIEGTKNGKQRGSYFNYNRWP